MKRRVLIFFVLFFSFSPLLAKALDQKEALDQERALVQEEALDLSAIELLLNEEEVEANICFKYRCYLDTIVGYWNGSGSTVHRAARKTLDRCRRDLSGYLEWQYCRTSHMYCICEFGVSQEELENSRNFSQ